MIYYDLKEEAQKKNIGDLVARETELKRMARTLLRQYNNNIVIVGSTGTGKSALIEGFAYRCAKGKVPGFENVQLIKLDNQNLKRLIDQSANAEIANYLSSAFKSIPDNSVIFIDDLEDVLGDKTFDLQKIFEPFFDTSTLRLCLTVGQERYGKLTENYPGFFENFEEIALKENDLKETEEIITALSPSFEKEYGIRINSGAIKNLVTQSKRISGDKKFPLLAIHFLDESLAYAKITGATILTSEHVGEIFSEKTGVPSTSLSGNDAELLKNLESEINKNVIGQERPVKIVSDIVRRSRMGLRNPNRPSGSFLFLGPSGVGKTELAKVLAKTVYGSERAFTRIDMSEFGEQHTVQRLVGAPPGYIGYEAGGQLTNSIKEQPYSLILLDEIEKAHPKIFDIFLQVFDDGRLTDGQGETVNFTNSIVVATSNLGINEIVEEFKSADTEEDGYKKLADPKFMEEKLMPILLANFRTEFLNRFDAIIIFNPLSLNNLVDIAMLEIKKIEERVKDHHIKFNIDPSILSGKIAEMNDYRFGARPIKRFVEETCEGLIAAKLLNK